MTMTPVEQTLVPNVQSKILDHCWVCGQKFLPAVGGTYKEDHHLVPRAYGGGDGPTVSLCERHHKGLHNIALKMISGKSFHELLERDPQRSIKENQTVNLKMIRLAEIVANAKRLTDNDPNKQAILTLSLGADLKNKIDKLMTVNPDCKSRARLIAFAVESLYKRTFTD